MSCILLHLCIYFLTALCPKEVVRVRLSHPSFNSLANAQCWRRGEPSSSRLSSSTARLWLGYEKYENVHLRRTAHQWARLMDWVSALWLSRIYDLHWLLKSPSLAAGSVVAAGVDPQKCQVEHASPAASCNARLNDSAQIRRKNLNSAECVTQQESWVIWRHFFLSFICLWFKLIFAFGKSCVPFPLPAGWRQHHTCGHLSMELTGLTAFLKIACRVTKLHSNVKLKA